LFCKNCGTKIDGLFCSGCGQKANDYNSKEQQLVFSQTRPVSTISPYAQTSGLAIAALVACFFVPFLGIILGFLARSEISNSQGMKTGENLATLAIYLGFLFMFLFVFFFFLVASSIWYSY
jgi:uncharacterized membrane protein YvbJ